MAPFGFFKKKDGDKGSPPLEQPQAGVTVPEGSTLTIQQAQDLLERIESSRVQELASNLVPIKDSVALHLNTIEGLASEMEHQKIKLEGLEQKLKSVVENSRRTVV